MLDLNVRQTKLTQGHPPAVMLLATTESSQTSNGSTDAAAVSKAVTNNSEAPPVDPRIIADKVYELMRRERAIERQRRGLWY